MHVCIVFDILLFTWLFIFLKRGRTIIEILLFKKRLNKEKEKKRKEKITGVKFIYACNVKMVVALFETWGFSIHDMIINSQFAG